MSEKRPKDMTREELAALPVRSPFQSGSLRHVNPEGVAGDDLLGFWRDVDGQWYCDPDPQW